jgi:hypothetical protein
MATTTTTSYHPHPHVTDVEALESTSMSRQHRPLVLSASDNVAGTWKHISVASTSAPASSITPLRLQTNPPPQRHRKCQNTWVVKNHPRVSSPLRHPSNIVPPGMDRDNPRGPHAAGSRPKSAKTPPASPECASALPGDVSNDRAHICARF